MRSTVDGMVSCGITKRFPISLHQFFLRATNLRKPLKPACTIPSVRHWRFLSLSFYLSNLLQCFTVRRFCRLFDKALDFALARGALAMCLQMRWLRYYYTFLLSIMLFSFVFRLKILNIPYHKNQSGYNALSMHFLILILSLNNICF